MSIIVLGIESSCDDTSAAIIKDGIVLSNIIANQEVHKKYGGVVPELASRAHQQNIIPVVEYAINKAEISKDQINAVAYTRGPGLLGSLLVGSSFSKGFSMAMDIPLIEVNHLHAHILSPFLKHPNENTETPEMPYLCLLVSGGHTQIVVVHDFLNMEIIGKTIDDAAGEAFDKCAKIMGLPYPGGPLIDQYAAKGNHLEFSFSKPQVANLDFSFSGLKTSFLYFIRDQIEQDALFIKKNLFHLCASIQYSIINILMDKLIQASELKNINRISIAGGVSANKGLRMSLEAEGRRRNWEIYIPHFQYSTDNAAMIGLTGYFKYKSRLFSSHDMVPMARYQL